MSGCECCGARTDLGLTDCSVPGPIHDAKGKVIAFINAIDDPEIRGKEAESAVVVLKEELKDIKRSSHRGDFCYARHGIGMGGGPDVSHTRAGIQHAERMCDVSILTTWR